MWDSLVIDPMINALLVLYSFLGQNFVLAIAVFTILIRLVTLPLNLRQQRSMMQTQEMQPQIQAIQKKYKDNPQKMQDEFKKIGYNPADSLMGCLPMLIQMPILIGLYRAILVVLGNTPQSLFELTQRVYPGIDLTTLLPIDNQFLWLNLGQPDPYYVLPVLVFVTMFAQQKLLSPKKKEDANGKNKKNQQDDPMAGMTQSMQYTMPLMFGFFSLTFQAGLSVYFVMSNLIGIAQGLYIRRVMPKPDEKKPTTLDLRAESPQDVEPEALPEPKSMNGSGSSKKTGKKKKKKR